MNPLKENNAIKSLCIGLSQTDLDDASDSALLDLGKVYTTADAVPEQNSVFPPLNPSHDQCGNMGSSTASNNSVSEGDSIKFGRASLTSLKPEDIASLREHSVTIETNIGPVFFIPRQSDIRISEGTDLANAPISELLQERLRLMQENGDLRKMVLSLRKLVRGRAGAVSKLGRH